VRRLRPGRADGGAHHRLAARGEWEAHPGGGRAAGLAPGAAVAVVVALGAAACAATGGGTTTTTTTTATATTTADSDRAALAAMAAEYWEKRLQADPIEATFIGERRFDDRMPDLSPEAFDREMARLHALRGQVDAVDARALPPADQVTRGLLLGEIDADLARGDCRLHEWAVDPRDGPQVVYLQLAELQPVTTVAQGRALVARWRQMGPALDQESANLRRGLASGRVATHDETARVLGQLDELLAKPDRDWVLRAPAAAKHPDWAPADAAAFVRDVDDAIATSIRPAFQRYRAVVRDEILPRARGDRQVGILNLPGGAACYRQLIKVHTSLALSPEEVHAFGLAEVARLREAITELGGQVLGTTDFAAIRRRLRSDPALFFKTRAEIEANARATLARSTAAMPRFLGRLPRAGCVVKPIAAYEEKDSPIAYYRPPAIDGSRGGTYYVNTSEPTTRPRYEAEALAFHESIPGHHVQIAIAQEMTGIPEFRKHAGVTAFVEGWGLYAEKLSDELGLYSGPLDRLGMLSLEIWRAGRLVVDTGMHAMGWSRQQAIDYLTANAMIADNNIVNEIDRYIGWPGQALAYKIGQREILRLRAEAEQRLGPRFDLRAFHDVVLDSGAVSLPVLRDQVTSWIAARSATPERDGPPR
jgi:uncharacterized protein (DUF885 family)